MSTTTPLNDAAIITGTTRPKLWTATVGYALVAAAATTAVAASLHAAGVSLDIADEPIPLLAFAQMTFLFSLVGLVIAAGIRRWAKAPHSTWVVTSVALTALSFVPDSLAEAAMSTRLTLMLTHVVAAAIVIPAVASRLPRR